MSDQALLYLHVRGSMCYCVIVHVGVEYQVRCILTPSTGFYRNPVFVVHKVVKVNHRKAA